MEKMSVGEAIIAVLGMVIIAVAAAVFLIMMFAEGWLSGPIGPPAVMVAWQGWMQSLVPFSLWWAILILLAGGALITAFGWAVISIFRNSSRHLRCIAW
ncbi:MAG TPA: hypothetical protein VJC16_07955 [Candidatus Nanoarchaeia archaeon]|nr:hypothetical protein [Candidatus Nanoarchaeia archaeon]